MQFCLYLRFPEVNKLSIPGHVFRSFSTQSDHRSAMATSNDIITIFSCCAAQETMLRNLQRQVDFQVVNCTGNKDPHTCQPTLTKLMLVHDS